MRLPVNAPILTAAQMRAAEQACAERGTSLAELMERAGRAVADLAWRMAARKPILILCGTGNNGGDGYVAARWLKNWGADVLVLALGPPSTDLAKAAAAQWDGPTRDNMDGVEPRFLTIDALFGVGLSRPIAPELRLTLNALKNTRILSVDVPSGLDGDGSQDWQPLWRANVTLALGALKPAHILQPMAQHCGIVLRDDLNEAWASPILSRDYASENIEEPLADGHKFSRGMVLIVSGPMSGAAHLSAAAAMRAGAGYVALRSRDATSPRLDAIISDDMAAYERRLKDKRVGAAAIGMGYPASSGLENDVKKLWDSGLPLVLDAAAIDAAMPLFCEKHDRKIILTPHEGEFSRNFSSLTGNKLEKALTAAHNSNAILIYKGADMIIAAPDGRTRAFWPGCSWLATAGTGDVLAGAVAAQLAKGGDAFDAACIAAGWHIAKASRIGRGLVADDLVRI